MASELKNSLFAAIVFIALFTFLLYNTAATNSGNSGSANLTIYDSTDSATKYTVCTQFCGEKGKSSSNLWTVVFSANYTNITNNHLNETTGNATVQIRFNQNGTWTNFVNMTFNATNLIWQYATNFSYKGTLNFSVNTTSSYGNITLPDSITIENTRPYILKTPSGRIDFDYDGTKNILQCTEDSICYYNFTANVSEDDFNDVLIFNYSTSANTTLTNFTLDSTTGMLAINYTNDDDIGGTTLKTIELTVRDSDDASDSAILEINVTPENDPPYFINLGSNRTINESGINLILYSQDEEEDVPYVYNVSFLSCTHAAVNPPTGPNNCTLFNLTSYNATATNISFIPQANQKGEYEINFSVRDSRNATYSSIVNWTVSWNDAPVLTYACDNERNATEDSQFTCRINVTDQDELNNFTFTTNYSWFTFNNSGTNSVTLTASSGNASALINFTARDAQVGNWSINVSVTDTGAASSSAKSNSTVFYFFVRNINDSVTIVDVQNITAYTSQNYTISVNATDDDLLITQKNIYNETLIFTTNNSNVNVSNSTPASGTNRSDATISFNPSILGPGNHTINVTVRDANNYSISSDIFTIFITDNSAPQWLISSRNFNLTENTNFYWNFSRNVSDTDSLNFTLEILDPIISPNPFHLTINRTTGVVNYTANDSDVGIWQVRITADDGKTPSSLDFNFTVRNVNDNVSFLQLGVNSPNSSISGLNLTTQEDNLTIFYFQINDDDLYVPNDQSSFYQESFTITTNLTRSNGTASNLFSFGSGQNLVNNLYQWSASFTPSKNDVGNYTLTVNVTDGGNSSVQRTFNLSISEAQHGPNITTIISDQVFSILNETFYLDVNATDLEDGSDGPNSNLTFRLQNLTSGGNFLTINSSTGIINFTFNSSYPGVWRFNLSVNDTGNSIDSRVFNITVYDYPRIIYPNSSQIYSFVENRSALLNFSANHTVGNNLNYTLMVNYVIKNMTASYGNGSNVTIGFTPNFTEETTCSGMVNLTLNVSNAKLSNTTSWLVEINHTNYPLTSLASIPDISGGTPSTISLEDYYYDPDATDSCNNQTILFSADEINGSAGGGAISVEVTNWVNGSTPSAVFSLTSDGYANYTISATEYNQSNSSQGFQTLTSNNFSVSLVVTESTTTSVSRGGGGGGSARVQVVSLKILVPEPVSARQKDKLIIPLGLENDGAVDLNGIVLSGLVAKDGIIRSDLVATFDKSIFDSLAKGEKENATLIVDIDTQTTGLFEVTINATVDRPKYQDWAKFYIEIDEDKSVLEKIIFTEEFLIGNPQCAELVDLINDAKDLYSKGSYKEAVAKAENALEGCKNAIAQPPSPRVYERLGDKFIGYTAIASLAAFVLGFGYYTFKKIRLKKQVLGVANFNNTPSLNQ